LEFIDEEIKAPSLLSIGIRLLDPSKHHNICPGPETVVRDNATDGIEEIVIASRRLRDLNVLFRVVDPETNTFFSFSFLSESSPSLNPLESSLLPR